jgi:iron complex transport system substrate-binding protein
MTIIRTRLAVLALASVVALAACGGDDDDASTTAPIAPATDATDGTDTPGTTATTAASATTNDTSTPTPTGGSAAGEAECIEPGDSDVDAFPHKVEPSHSELWSIEYRGTYAVLSVPDTEFPDQPDLSYILVPCGAEQPDLSGDLADAQVFEVPVSRTVTNHNNGLAMLDAIGAVPTVVGMSDSQLGLAGDPYVSGLIEAADDPQNVGEGDGVEFEVTLGLEPDIVVMAGYGPGYTNVSDTVARGLPAVMVANRLEPTALGSAEWMKFLSVFYGTEAAANDRFAGIQSAYDEAVSTVEGQLPEGYSAAYLCIEPDNGCEFMYAHGANSLNGKILETLGATNVFAEGNTAANGQNFDYEAALGLAADADFFVDYELPEAVEATLASDDRFRQFAPFAEGNYITYVEDNYAFCRFNLYVQVDILVTDYAIGMAPDLFPGRTGTCFAKPV